MGSHDARPSSPPGRDLPCPSPRDAVWVILFTGGQASVGVATRSDPLLDVVVAQAELLQARMNAVEQARGGDDQGATMTLSQAAESLKARGHGDVASAARARSDELRDTEAFERSASHRESMQAVPKQGAASSLEREARDRLHPRWTRWPGRAH